VSRTQVELLAFGVVVVALYVLAVVTLVRVTP
jgi:hypothetical protein